MINIGKLTIIDVTMYELSLVAFTFFLVSVWGGLADFVIGTGWYWFLLVSVVLGLVPSLKMLKLLKK